MPRVVAGKCRGMILEAPKGDSTRPTTDKVKEALFSSIQNRVVASAFLDVFSGTGQMAIEALSRGAESAVLIDQAGKSMQVIKRNLEKTHLEDTARTLKMPFAEALRLLGKEEAQFDIIFMDPPYAMADKYAATASELIKKYDLLRKDGIFIVESDANTLINENVTNMTFLKSCKYGSTLITFFVE
ncbi:MAG: 16S rRNA (guanine(966)-N(2))-methyltransferase RsmD [Clostridiales bacterium]|nr:16S rRNA (guanine(966)-N(2))-methyltransferase RsmD [Clostridiales bacterium]